LLLACASSSCTFLRGGGSERCMCMCMSLLISLSPCCRCFP
jgi:hypothetical protein